MATTSPSRRRRRSSAAVTTLFALEATLAAATTLFVVAASSPDATGTLSVAGRNPRLRGPWRQHRLRNSGSIVRIEDRHPRLQHFLPYFASLRRCSTDCLSEHTGPRTGPRWPHRPARPPTSPRVYGDQTRPRARARQRSSPRAGTGESPQGGAAGRRRREVVQKRETHLRPSSFRRCRGKWKVEIDQEPRQSFRERKYSFGR